MANITQNGNIITKGTDCYVFVDFQDDSGAGVEKIGLASEYSATKDMEVQKANVLGEILPVSVDIVGINATIHLSGLIPAKNVSSEYYTDGKSVKNFNPDAKKIISGENGAKIPYICLKDKKSGSIIGYGTWGVPSRYAENTQGKNYVQVSVDIQLTDYKNGPDYEQVL